MPGLPKLPAHAPTFAKRQHFSQFYILLVLIPMQHVFVLSTINDLMPLPVLFHNATRTCRLWSDFGQHATVELY